MKPINSNAPVISSQQMTIHAPAEKVWSLLTNIDQWPAWQSDIAASKLNGALQAGTTFSWKTGGSGILSTLHTVEPVSEFGWTGKAPGLFAIHNWHLSEANGITTVQTEESMEGFLAVLFKKMLRRKLEKGLIQWLQLLKTVAENKEYARA